MSGGKLIVDNSYSGSPRVSLHDMTVIANGASSSYEFLVDTGRSSMSLNVEEGFTFDGSGSWAKYVSGVSGCSEGGYCDTYIAGGLTTGFDQAGAGYKILVDGEPCYECNGYYENGHSSSNEYVVGTTVWNRGNTISVDPPEEVE